MRFVTRHVNILASETRLGTDRITRMRFDFELVDVSYLGAVLATVKSIDSVYDAYRIVPGKGG